MTKFKELLRQCDLHGTQLARRVGVSVPLVHCWANGTSVPRAEIIPKIANALGVSVGS